MTVLPLTVVVFYISGFDYPEKHVAIICSLFQHSCVIEIVSRHTARQLCVCVVHIFRSTAKQQSFTIVTMQIMFFSLDHSFACIISLCETKIDIVASACFTLIASIIINMNITFFLFEWSK